ncbi:phosphoribosylamine--glycine ligase [Clostridia bacterium]|nr:phosphoribosylamine--glycine ligase [Clostridia bacterium]
MNVLLIGGGGREHAMAWKLLQSPRVTKLFCAPGNAGTAKIAENVPIKVTDFPALLSFAEEQNIDFTIVGPDDPLSLGIVDAFEARGLKIWGPNKAAAAIESSKVFSKDLMRKYNIPTAKYASFTDIKLAFSYLDGVDFPVVIKADGLALGKGVVICQNREEANAALSGMLIERRFGDAGRAVVIEEFLTGRELSVFAFCDGRHILPFANACDYKRAKDGDKGPNTGGMGAISPCPFYTADMHKACLESIYKPTLAAMAQENRPFKGVLYFGLMETKNGVKVIEYNARFGDPEAQVVLPRMEGDLLELMESCVDGTLDRAQVKLGTFAAACVVLASDGYPESYETGYKITGIDIFSEQTHVFQAGTRLSDDGDTLTAGGRVLAAVGLGENLGVAVGRAYGLAEKISFENKYCRDDIGNVRRAL